MVEKQLTCSPVKGEKLEKNVDVMIPFNPPPIISGTHRNSSGFSKHQLPPPGGGSSGDQPSRMCVFSF